MKLIIMRHGQAESIRVEDIQRNLTALGRKQASKAGKWLMGYLGVGKAVDIALVSNYARAEQTYQQLCQHLLVSQQQVCLDVIPEGDPKVAHDYIDWLLTEQPTLEVVLIVSHMPFVSYFLEEVHIHKQSMLFDTSSLVVVDYNPQTATGEIESIYHPN